MDNTAEFLDVEYQRKTKIQSLMESPGMVIFNEDMLDDLSYAEAQLAAGKTGFISESGLNRFNYFLGMKAGLEMVRNRLASYADDLIGADVKPHKK